MPLRSMFCWSLLLVALSVLFSASALAQQDLFQLLGTPPANPTVPIPMGFVNLKNGNVHLEFPLRHYTERAGGAATAKLVYDSLNCYWYAGVDLPPQSAHRIIRHQDFLNS